MSERKNVVALKAIKSTIETKQRHREKRDRKEKNGSKEDKTTKCFVFSIKK